MITSASSQELAKQIEQVVSTHLAASQMVATTTIERVFAKVNGESALSSQATKRTRRGGRRRTSEEVAELSERFHSAVCKKPGETMMVLAGQVGVRPRELKVPVARLKRAGRVRCVGQKSHMRYFPMVGEANADKEVAA